MDDDVRRFLERARVARLATADDLGRPAVVPVCFAVDGERVVTPIDEKPKEGRPRDLRRVRDVEANPRVALVADRYDEDWSRLAWVQVRGTASVVEPGRPAHESAVRALRRKYDQYDDHDLNGRPVIEIRPGHVVSWGDLAADPG